jgi:hypothetical protein
MISGGTTFLKYLNNLNIGFNQQWPILLHWTEFKEAQEFVTTLWIWSQVGMTDVSCDDNRNIIRDTMTLLHVSFVTNV